MRPEVPSYSSSEMGSSGSSWTVKAQSRRAIARKRTRSATLIPGQMRRLFAEKNRQESFVASQSGENLDVPSPECPVVAFHRVPLMRRFCRAELIAEVAIGVEGETVKTQGLLMRCARPANNWGEDVRVWIAGFVVMHCIAIQHQGAALGNVHPVVCEVLRGTVRGGVPERSVHAQDLFDYGANEGQVLLILGTRPTGPADDGVELVVGTQLDVGVLANESEEPLNDTGRLSSGMRQFISARPSQTYT